MSMNHSTTLSLFISLQLRKNAFEMKLWFCAEKTEATMFMTAESRDVTSRVIDLLFPTICYLFVRL